VKTEPETQIALVQHSLIGHRFSIGLAVFIDGGKRYIRDEMLQVGLFRALPGANYF